MNIRPTIRKLSIAFGTATMLLSVVGLSGLEVASAETNKKVYESAWGLTFEDERYAEYVRDRISRIRQLLKDAKGDPQSAAWLDARKILRKKNEGDAEGLEDHFKRLEEEEEEAKKTPRPNALSFNDKMTFKAALKGATTSYWQGYVKFEHTTMRFPAGAAPQRPPAHYLFAGAVTAGEVKAIVDRIKKDEAATYIDAHKQLLKLLSKKKEEAAASSAAVQGFDPRAKVKAEAEQEDVRELMRVVGDVANAMQPYREPKRSKH